MTDFQMLGNSFCYFWPGIDVPKIVPLFTPKVHIFENSSVKILAQLP